MGQDFFTKPILNSPCAHSGRHWELTDRRAFHPQSGEVRSDAAEGIACWFIDTDYNEDSFFVRHAYFLSAKDHYKTLKKTQINEEARETPNSDISRPFPQTGGREVRGAGDQSSWG